MSEIAICNGCGFSDHPDNFKGCLTAYHDLRCPKCSTTDIDTSKVNEAWKARGEVYGYGDHNCLNIKST